MNKLVMAIPLCFLAASCATTDRSVPIVDDAGHTHYTMSHMMDQRGTSVFPADRRATGRKVFIFDPKAAAWGAYDKNGHLVKTGAASGGKSYCDDVKRSCRTVTGTYRLYSKKGENCKSSKYPLETGGGARMPYCMHFYKGYSIHAAYEVPKWNSSHGCIRVLPSAAKWLNEDFMTVGTTVIVKPYH
ncbi:MAG: L,D-transpeptidase [Gammaproteobacteria bacterium]|nr:L,D-transpeptidase [Gammaproteobacteria bacterium]